MSYIHPAYRKHLEAIAVKANNVEDYLNRYYRQERKRDFAALLRSYQREFKSLGYVLTSKHDNITGAIIAWLGPKSAQNL